MGTQGWTCVCVWYMCVCECAHVCVHKCECVLVNVKVLSRVQLFVIPCAIQVHGILQARILEWVDFS